MKIITRIALAITVLLFTCQVSVAQDISITEEYKQQAIQKLSQLMNDFYVFPEVAKSTEVHLKKQLEDGYYVQFKDDDAFADALTKSSVFEMDEDGNTEQLSLNKTALRKRSRIPTKDKTSGSIEDRTQITIKSMGDGTRTLKRKMPEKDRDFVVKAYFKPENTESI